MIYSCKKMKYSCMKMKIFMGENSMHCVHPNHPWKYLGREKSSTGQNSSFHAWKCLFHAWIFMHEIFMPRFFHVWNLSYGYSLSSPLCIESSHNQIIKTLPEITKLEVCLRSFWNVMMVRGEGQSRTNESTCSQRKTKENTAYDRTSRRREHRSTECRSLEEIQAANWNPSSRHKGGMEFGFVLFFVTFMPIVAKTGVPGENHRLTPSHWQLSHMPTPWFEPRQRWEHKGGSRENPM